MLILVTGGAFMSTVSETIPAALKPDVDAALDWFNRDQPIPFEVTGILGPDDALASDAPRKLKLVLCGGDRGEQRSFRVASGGAGHADAPERLRALLRSKYRVRDWWVAFIFDTSKSVAVRLIPAPS
jgi:hypothetical protein